MALHGDLLADRAELARQLDAMKSRTLLDVLPLSSRLFRPDLQHVLDTLDPLFPCRFVCFE